MLLSDGIYNVEGRLSLCVYDYRGEEERGLEVIQRFGSRYLDEGSSNLGNVTEHVT